MSTRNAGAVDIDFRSGLRLLSLGETARIRPNEQILTSCIDAGGAQAVSQLLILDHLMEKISQDNNESFRVVVKRPCDVFDTIGGTGTGG
jgi:hypothetical protein